MKKKVQGFTDEAAQEDLFEIKKYIKGLARFIENCNTPMTISIQGAWGTGKTSIMQIINRTLEESGRTKSFWFNTWQFSQFSMENELSLSLLTCLLDEFTISENKKKEVNKITSTLRALKSNVGKVGKEIVLSITDNVMGGRIADNLEKSIDVLQGGVGENTSPITAIKSLRDAFANCVDETLEKTGKERIVVFIDDLDRLEPKKAVELLEVLKVFLDCKKCVFVLAIDYDVVCKGVSAKYGKDMSDEKGKKFFEKIIQVPFKMPVAEYNISNYVKKCFEEIGISCPNDEIENYIDLIKYSIGANPRSMKRLFNAYLLLTIVVSEEILESDQNKQLLFAILCLQHAFEKTYNYIVSNRSVVTENTLRLFAEQDGLEDGDRVINSKLDMKEMERIQPFMQKLLDVLDSDNNGEISNEEMENFRNVLGISTITSSEEENVVSGKTQEVFNISELNIGDKNVSELESFIQKLQEIDVDVSYSLRNRSNRKGHVIMKNGDGKSFADIYMRKKGFVVDCIFANRAVLTISNAREILEKNDVEWEKNDRYVTMKVYDEDTISDCIELAKLCYESYKEK